MSVVGGGAAMRASPATVTETGAGAGRLRARRQSHTPNATIMTLVTTDTRRDGEMADSATAVSTARAAHPSGVNM